MPKRNVPDAQAGRYDADFMLNEYDREEGLLVLPVMRAGAAPKVIQVHGSIGSRRVRFSYAKRGTPPLFPTIGVDTPTRSDGSPGDKFLGGELVVGNTIGGDQSQLDYNVTGEYRFVQSAVRGSGSAFQSGRRPYKTNLLDASMMTSAIAIGGGLGAVGLSIVDPSQFTKPAPGTRASDAPNIDFTSPDWVYADTELAKELQNDSLIL